MEISMGQLGSEFRRDDICALSEFDVIAAAFDPLQDRAALAESVRREFKSQELHARRQRLLTARRVTMVLLAVALVMLIIGPAPVVLGIFFAWLIIPEGAAELMGSKLVRHDRSFYSSFAFSDYLALSNDVRVINPLALCLRWRTTAPFSSRYLQRLLPRLTTRNRSLVSDEAMKALTTSLKESDWMLTVAILRALQDIGDEQTIGSVKVLMKGTKNGAIRSAAEDCLSALVSRAARQHRILLRPVESPLRPEHVLLRPAINAAGDSERLLRTIE